MTAVLEEPVIDDEEVRRWFEEDPREYRMNLPELRRQIEWARQENDVENYRPATQEPSWNQGTWLAIDRHGDYCHTACCIAGHTVISNGATIPEIYLAFDGSFTVERVVYEGRSYSVRSLAQKMLGLTGGQANLLFNGGNSIEVLEAILARWESGQFWLCPCGDLDCST